MAKQFSTPKPDKQRKFQQFRPEQRKEWMNLNINIDSYSDHWEAIRQEFIGTIAAYPAVYLEKIAKSFGLSKSHRDQDWDEVLFNDIKWAIQLYCIWKFASVDPLCYATIYKIRPVRGKTNMPALLARLAQEYVTVDLRTAFIQMLLKKAGHARYTYHVADRKKKIDLEFAKKIMRSMTSYLKQEEGKRYELRFADKIDDTYYFLILKETTDRIYPAIPENLRVVSARYLLISIDIKTENLSVHTQIGREAKRIRYYIARRSGAKILTDRKTADYNPEAFFELLLEQEQTEGFTLLNAKISKHSMGDHTMEIKDRMKKNNIIAALQKLKHDGYLELKSFSEFSNMLFNYGKIRYHIDIYEDRWGQVKLDVADRGKPSAELSVFKHDFESVFSIPIGTWLKNENTTLNKSAVIQKILDFPTLESVLPDDVSDILMELIGEGIIEQPATSVKRRCKNCYKVYWHKGSCPECGSNEYYFDGEYIDLQVNTDATFNFFLEHIKQDTTLKVKKVKHKIESYTFKFLELLNDDRKSLSIYISKGAASPRVISHYARTGNPLLVIIVKYAPALKGSVTDMGFECLDFATGFAQASTGELLPNIKNALQAQHNKWKDKLSRKGYSSYGEYTGRDEKKYNDQRFEVDIFNMLHEIFLIGDRLGGHFAGVPAPDGVISIQDYGNPLARYCLAWDCKFSVLKDGYRLADPPKKHRHYINALKNNDKVLFYGGLKSYLIISQNMNMTMYEKFYTQLVDRFRWKGQVIFVQADMIARIYEAYRDNQSLIASFPNVFYSALYKLFQKTDRKDSIPYRHLSQEKIKNTFDGIKATYKSLRKSFTFARKDFTA